MPPLSAVFVERIGTAAGVAVLVLAACAAWAQPMPEGMSSRFAEDVDARPDDTTEESEVSAAVPPAEAARRALSSHGGRVLNVILEQGPDGPFYRVKLLDRGQVRIVHVDAAP